MHCGPGLNPTSAPAASLDTWSWLKPLADRITVSHHLAYIPQPTSSRVPFLLRSSTCSFAKDIELRPKPLADRFLAWVVPVLTYSEAHIIQECGLDAAMYLRVIRLGEEASRCKLAVQHV